MRLEKNVSILQKNYCLQLGGYFTSLEWRKKLIFNLNIWLVYLVKQSKCLLVERRQNEDIFHLLFVNHLTNKIYQDCLTKKKN